MSNSDKTISTGHANRLVKLVQKLGPQATAETSQLSATVIDVTCLSEATKKLTDCTCKTPLDSTTGTSTTLSKRARLRACGCRDNPQQEMAPRRLGSRVPSLCTVGSLGPRSFSYAAVYAGSRVLCLVAV